MNINDREFLWSEKYRPNNIADCILPVALTKIFKAQVRKGELQNLLLSGVSGVGKTTVALALCEELGCTVKFIRASEDSGIDMIRTDVRNFASNGSFGGTKVVIFDEAERLTQATQEALRGMIEEFSANCRFIFTCNHKNRILAALRASRLVEIDFGGINSDELAPLASRFNKRVKEILTIEKVTYDDKVVAQVIVKYFPDFRKTLNELQAYANISATIDEGMLSKWADVNMVELLDTLKSKNFNGMRKWVVKSLDNDPTTILRKLYDELVDATEQGPELVIILADYMYRAAFVADAEVNLVACLTEIMNRIIFKE